MEFSSEVTNGKLAFECEFAESIDALRFSAKITQLYADEVDFLLKGKKLLKEIQNKPVGFLAGTMNIGPDGKLESFSVSKEELSKQRIGVPSDKWCHQERCFLKACDKNGCYEERPATPEEVASMESKLNDTNVPQSESSEPLIGIPNLLKAPSEDIVIALEIAKEEGLPAAMEFLKESTPTSTGKKPTYEELRAKVAKGDTLTKNEKLSLSMFERRRVGFDPQKIHKEQTGQTSPVIKKPKRSLMKNR